MNYICEQTKQGSWRVSASNPARVIATLLDEDDARLMAAAPELLAACKLAYLELNFIPAFGDSIGNKITKAQIGVLLKRFQSVIARAEGGRP